MKAPSCLTISLRSLARALFITLLLWPTLHAALTTTLGVSAWRLFGWGMYATPYPMTHSQCVVVWTDIESEDGQPWDAALAVAMEPHNSELNARCLLSIRLDERSSSQIICDDPELTEHLAFVKQFGTPTHAAALVRRTAALQKTPDARTAYVIVRRPRLRVWPPRHYAEATIFAVSGSRVHTYRFPDALTVLSLREGSSRTGMPCH